MDITNKEIVCLELDSELTDLTGRLWNYRNNGGIEFYETGGVFDKPYIKFTQSTVSSNYLYSKNVTDKNELGLNKDEFTVEFYIRNIVPTTNTSQWLISYLPDDGSSFGWGIHYNVTTKKLYFWEKDTTITTRASTTDLSLVTQWTHIAFILKDSKIYCYVDGIKASEMVTQYNYMQKTNVKDGIYIGRGNFGWSTDPTLKCDFGGLKISNYARYNVDSENIIPRIFNIEQNITYDSLKTIDRTDKASYFHEMYENTARWISNKLSEDYITNDSATKALLVTTKIGDNSVIKTNNGMGHVAIRFNTIGNGNELNNIDQNWTIFWDVYFLSTWCSYTTQKTVKVNHAWNSTVGSATNGTQVIMWYGRDTASANSSFISTLGSLSSYTAEPATQHRTYLGYKFEPNVAYRMALSYKNHKLNHYINGVRVAVVDHSNLNNIAFAQHYSSLMNFSLGGASTINEYNWCDKLDNVFVLSGEAFDTPTYDHNAFDYDTYKQDAIDEYYQHYNVKPITPSSNLNDYIDNTPPDNFENIIPKDNINTVKSFEDDSGYILNSSINDVKQRFNYRFLLDGYDNTDKISYKVLDRNFIHMGDLNNNGVVEHNIVLPSIKNDYITIVDNNNDKIRKIYATDSEYAKGYISGRITSTSCNIESSYIKLYDSFTNEFIKEYPIINGSYTIPNLNYYNRYDIVLCDRNAIIESKISSKRQPILYNIYDANFNMISNSYNGTYTALNDLTIYNEIAYKSYDFTDMNNVLHEDFSLTRNSVGTYFNENGDLMDAPINAPRFEWADIKNNNVYECKGLLVEVESVNLVDHYLVQLNYYSPSGTRSVSAVNNKHIFDAPNYNIKYLEILPSVETHKNFGSGVVVTQSVRLSKEANNNFSCAFSFFNNQTYHRIVASKNYSNIWYSVPFTTENRAYRQVDIVSIDYRTDTTFYILGRQVERLPYATSLIRSVNNTNNTRRADIFNFSTNNKVTGTYLYRYINQSSPTTYSYEFITYNDEIPLAKPNGFISGWMCNILCFDDIIESDMVKQNIVKTYYNDSFIPLQNGIWFGNFVSWGNETNADWNNTVNNNSLLWDENFKYSSDFRVYNYKHDSVGSSTLQHNQASFTINKSPIGKTFIFMCDNSKGENSYADVSMEFLDSGNNIIAVLKVERDTKYSNAIWYGDRWESIIQANTIGAYKKTHGVLIFTENKIIYKNSLLYGVSDTTDANDSFTYHNVNMFKVAKIKVTRLFVQADKTDVTGGSASSFVYLKEV